MKARDNLSLASRSLRKVPGVAALLFSCMLVSGQPAYGQVPDGGLGDDLIEAPIEQSVEDQVSQQVEDRIVERVEDDELVLGGHDDVLDRLLAERIEQQVEASTEDAVEEAVSDNVEVILEGNIENDVEQDVEETIEAIVQQSVEGSVEEKIDEKVVDTVTSQLEASVEVEVDDAVATNIDQNVADVVESGMEVQLASAVEARVEDGVDDIIEMIEVDEGRIQKDQWLVMAAPEVFDQLASEGYLFETVTELPGMGLRLAEVAAPSSFDITRVRQGVIDIVGSDRAEVDLNHIYTAGDQLAEQTGEGIMPRAAIDFPADTDQLPLRIGMIDSQVDVSHPSLHNANIQTHAFTNEGAVLPNFHGTAIASIIVGHDAGYVGIAPNAEVFAASVFEQDPQRGEIASTVSLVRALDWLITSGVDVINISLAGPPNRLLEAALKRASESNVTILAAAGNGGPVAGPMYPAAYKTVVAVTAVDDKGQVFRLANRGDYLELAAPGVGMRHAKSGGGYVSSSGTSFAVPFAATAVARLRQLQPADDALEQLCRTAEDLGPPGRDSIYGFGLLRPARS